MNLKGQLQWEDYLDAVFLRIRPAGLSLVILVMVGLCFACSLLVGLFSSLRGEIAYTLILPGATIVLAILGCRFLFLPRHIKRIFSQQKELAAPFEVELTEDSLNMSNEFGSSRRPWSQFFDWRENDKLFLLFHSSVLFTALPKRIFSDEAQMTLVRRRLSESVVPPRRRFPAALVILVIVVLAMVIFTLIIQFRAPSP